MLFKFKSKATADLIMLEPDARRLLKIMLGDEPLKGILMVQDLPVAQAKLDAAVHRDEMLRQERAQKAAQQAESEPNEALDELPAIRLAQRAAPMQQMIQRCIVEERNIVWGV